MLQSKKPGLDKLLVTDALFTLPLKRHLMDAWMTSLQAFICILSPSSFQDTLLIDKIVGNRDLS